MAHNKENKPKGPMAALAAKVRKLEERLDALECKPAKKSIHKIEEHAGEAEPTPRPETKLVQDDKVKIQSAINASKLLPPNLANKEGRHTAENIQAICGFKMTDEIYSAVYPEA